MPSPLATEVAAGVMLMPVSAGATVRLAALEVMPLNEADIEVLPKATPVATPVALLIEAIALLAEAQVTLLVMLAVLASV